MVRLVPFVFVLFFVISRASSVKANEIKVVIPEGTLILTHLAEPMSSADVHTGDVFQFVVAQDVVVNGYIVIPASAKGVGHVTEAHAAGTHGKAGSIRIAFDYLFATDGSQIPVAHNKQAEEQDRSTLGATALGILLTGGLGLFFHNFVHGSNITIPDDAKAYITTLAPRAIIVDSVKNAAPSPGPASTVVPSPSPSP